MNGLAKYRIPAALGVALLGGLLFPPSGAAQQAERLTLRQSIDLALKQSVVLHAAREGVQGAEAQRKEALTGFLPKLSTSYSYTRLNKEPYFNFPGVPPLIPASTMITGTRDNYNWQIEARQPLFAGGAIVANYETNRLGAEIARHEEAAVAQELVREVKIAYFTIIKAERMLAVARQSLEQRQAHRDRARGFYETGLTPRNDLLHAEVESAKGEQSLLRAGNALEMAKARFNTLLRRDIGAPLEIEDTLSEPPASGPLESCIAAALERRPELRAAALRAEQSRSLVKLSASDYYPSVSAVGNYGRYGDTAALSGTSYKDRENWQALVVANWNFWEWGKTKNRVDAGRSKENQAEDLLAHARDQVVLEVKNAYLLLQEAEKQLPVAKKAIAQAEENFRINSERYQEQVETSLAVIDAQTLLAGAKADYATALAEAFIQMARLEKAMGETDKGEERP